MSNPEQRPKKSVGAKSVRVNDLPDRYPRAQGVAPPPAAEPTLAEALPSAEPPFAFPVTDAESLYGVELVPLAAARRVKPALLPKVLWRVLLGVAAVATFFTGMECGYWRAGRRYENALKKAESQVAALLPKPETATPEPKKPAEAHPTATKSEATRKPETSKREASKSVESTEPEAAKPAPTKAASPKSVDPPRPTTLVKFEQVRPILAQKCFSCHTDKPRKAELDTRTPAALLKGGESGPAVKPGDPTGSVLWEYISTDKMPPAKGNKLTAAEKALIHDWIAGGAK